MYITREDFADFLYGTARSWMSVSNIARKEDYDECGTCLAEELLGELDYIAGVIKQRIRVLQEAKSRKELSHD